MKTFLVTAYFLQRMDDSVHQKTRCLEWITSFANVNHNMYPLTLPDSRSHSLNTWGWLCKDSAIMWPFLEYIKLK